MVRTTKKNLGKHFSLELYNRSCFFSAFPFIYTWFSFLISRKLFVGGLSWETTEGIDIITIFLLVIYDLKA